MTSCLAHYKSFEFTDGPWRRTVFRRGEGPAVIVIHEIPGLHPLVVRLADRIAEAGMSVYLPSLFGEPGRPFSPLYQLRSTASVICVRREFSMWATDRIESNSRMAEGLGASRSSGMWRQRGGRDWSLPHRRVRARDDDRTSGHRASARRTIPSSCDHQHEEARYRRLTQRNFVRPAEARR